MNIFNIRADTWKPPNIFTEAKNIAISSKIVVIWGEEKFRFCSAPKITMPDMALVTLISGEWSNGVTFQIAKYPINPESIKISIK